MPSGGHQPSAIMESRHSDTPGGYPYRAGARLTVSDEEEDRFEAIRAGASGYLLKDIPLDEMADAVRALINLYWLRKRVHSHQVRSWVRENRIAPQNHSGVSGRTTSSRCSVTPGSG